MEKKRVAVREYVQIAAGTVLMAGAVNCAFASAGLVTGGFSGVAIIVRHFTELPVWLISALLNVPLFLFAAKRRGGPFLRKALTGGIFLPFFLALVPEIPLTGQDVFLAALFGGVLQGVGLGLVFAAGGTTGGTDLTATLLQDFFPGRSAAWILQLLDGAVVLLGAGTFGIQKALYAVVAVVVTSRVIDMMAEGLNFAKAAYIISEHAEELARVLMKRLNRGVTGIPVRGMYSGRQKNMLFCTVARKQLHVLKRMVAELDPSAFLIILDAREVLGEGFSGRNKV